MRAAILLLSLLTACEKSPAIDDAGREDAAADGGAPRSLPDRVRGGSAEEEIAPRPSFATIAVVAHGERELALEVRRDAGYRHLRRVVLRGEGGWTTDEADGEVFHDVVVHPSSGDVTIAIEDTTADREGFSLLRLDARGETLARQPLPTETLPASDRDPSLPSPPWRMRARPLGALSQGWARLAARGDDLVVVFQSIVDSPDLGDDDLVSGVTSLAWSSGRWTPEWTRLVDGRHDVEPPLWSYDEFRFIDVLMRPLLAVDPVDGAVIVGRTWAQSRCYAAERVFGELTRRRCFEEAAGNIESRVLPFFYTVFSSAGERRGSHVFVPRDGFYYGVHDLAARDGEVVLAGAVARGDGHGGVALYPSVPGGTPNMVAFDGLVAILDRDTGAARIELQLDRGRGDLFTSLSWRHEGILVAGAADWDRWPGGMSVSRGADPWLALISPVDGDAIDRVFPRPWPSRHALAYDVEAFADRIVVAGADDAPMTHSGDGGRLEAMTFGALSLTLR